MCIISLLYDSRYRLYLLDAKMFNQLVSWPTGLGDASARVHSLVNNYSLKTKCISNQRVIYTPHFEQLASLLQPRYKYNIILYYSPSSQLSTDSPK